MFAGLIVLWTILVSLFGATALAIRIASRTRLSEILEGRGKEALLRRFFALQHEYARTALVYQRLWLVLFVITLFSGLPATDPNYLRLIYVFVACLAWVLVFDVAIPLAWARYAGDAYLARVLPALEMIRTASLPLLAIVRAVDEIVRRLLGAPRALQDDVEQIEREIMDAVSHGETSGAVQASEKAMIKSVMVLDEKLVAEIMTPRTDMKSIAVTATFDQVRELILTHGHSRIPVYKDSMDEIVGVLYAKDLLGVENTTAFSPKNVMRKVTFVPETKDLASLLEEFQAHRVHIAIIIDEYGGTSGLVTFEDILEELVGEIADEHERPPSPPIIKIDDRTAEVDARVRVEELNEAMNIALPEDEAYDTIGGFVFSKLGRIPVEGERILEDNVRIEILEAQERSISRLRVAVLDSVSREQLS